MQKKQGQGVIPGGVHGAVSSTAPDSIRTKSPETESLSLSINWILKAIPDRMLTRKAVH